MNKHLVFALIVLRKELTDALRDRRTLLTVLVSSVLMGPLILVAISALVASLESRAEQREVYVAGLASAPTLRASEPRLLGRTALAKRRGRKSRTAGNPCVRAWCSGSNEIRPCRSA